MGDSAIEWTDKSWNPTRGCSRVSPGCVNCYAERQAIRHEWADKEHTRPGLYHGLITITNGHPAWTGRVMIATDYKLTEPLRWHKPARIFVNSMSDLFHEGLSDDEIDRVFAVMAYLPRHTFQVLTKRHERMREWASGGDRPKRISEKMVELWDKNMDAFPNGVAFPRDCRRWPLPQVTLGVSVEDMQRAHERVTTLLDTPAARRFVSYEPALGEVDFRVLANNASLGEGEPWYDALSGYAYTSDGSNATGGPKLDWVIVGGESGPGARSFNIAWAEKTVADCKAAGVPVFVKQMGAFAHLTRDGYTPVLADRYTFKDKKGGDMEEWPTDLQVREFPA